MFLIWRPPEVRTSIFSSAIFLACFIMTSAPDSASARPKPLSGPVPAFVERVIDGDTLLVRARIWLGQELRVLVRVGGIDAPEMRARCERERKLALSARDFVRKAIGRRKILLTSIRQGKYAGRVIAEVRDERGEPLAPRLLAARLARPYRRGRRGGWCRSRSSHHMNGHGQSAPVHK
jgi:endonuclease YncB( thermonuclease family)